MQIIRTDAREVVRLLEPVVPHLPTGDLHPGLAQVPIAVVDEHLVAFATDRHTAGFQRVRLRHPAPPGAAFRLLREEATGLLALLKDAGARVPVSFTVQPDGASTINAGPDLPDFPNGASIRTAAPALTSIPLAGIPCLDHLLDTGDAAGAELTFALGLLERFRPATAHNGQIGALDVRYPSTAHAHAVVRCGSDFVGILAQVRHADSSGTHRTDVVPEHAAAWRPVVAETFQRLRDAAASHRDHLTGATR